MKSRSTAGRVARAMTRLFIIGCIGSVVGILINDLSQRDGVWHRLDTDD